MLASPIGHESTTGKQNFIVVRFELIIFITCGMVARVACGLLRYPRKLWTKLVLEKNAVQLLLQLSLQLF